MSNKYSTATTNSMINNNNNDSSDFLMICTLILSYPLYFSYLIFFSPYLFKLLSFFSPLFITTSLVFLSLLTTFIPFHSIINSKESFLLAVRNTMLEKLRPELNNEGEKWLPVVDFEVYKIVFEAPVIEVLDEYPDEKVIFEDNPVEKKALHEEEKAGNKCESVTIEQETGGANCNKVKEVVKKYESILGKSKSEVNEMSMEKDLKPKGGSLRFDHEKKLPDAFYGIVGSPLYAGSFGSMRKEREWRQTLACKLFEERHSGGYNNNVNGGNSDEGMDLLWEAHETESNRETKDDKNTKGKKGTIQRFMAVNEEKDEDFGQEEEDNGKFCCLQALKLSAGKMNLNMGRPSLIKFGKAFKGFGWLHTHAKKQGKKGYK